MVEHSGEFTRIIHRAILYTPLSVAIFGSAPRAGRQPPGAAGAAAMVAPRVDGACCAAVVMRCRFRCRVCGGGSVAASAGLRACSTHAPAHPAQVARGIANARHSLTSPPQGSQSGGVLPRRPNAAGKSRACKKLASELVGFRVGGPVGRRFFGIEKKAFFLRGSIPPSGASRNFAQVVS